MKKRILFLFAVALLLTGCCLQHDWVDATCENPKTCSKCGETEGNALGHEWIDADCENPERCTRCDASEGEPLGHTYSEWEVISNSQMGSKCTVCGEMQEQKIDREVLGLQNVLGKWKAIAIQPGGADNDWEPMRDPSIWVEFFEDGTMKYDIGGSGEGDYKFDEYVDSHEQYWYYVTFDDGYCRIRLDSDGQLYWVANRIWICFER